MIPPRPASTRADHHPAAVSSRWAPTAPARPKSTACSARPSASTRSSIPRPSPWGRCATSRSKSAWTPTPKTTSSAPPSATSSPVCSSPSTCPTRATSTSRRWCIGNSPTTTPSPSAARFGLPRRFRLTCLSDGNICYQPTWAVETNYYMDLGFLPPSMQYFSISGRAGWYGNEGHDTDRCRRFPGLGVFNRQGRIQLRTDPSDASTPARRSGARNTRTSSTSGSPTATGRTSSASTTTRRPRRLGTIGGVPARAAPAPNRSLYSGVTVKF